MPVLRSISLILALTISLVLMLFPFLLRHVSSSSLHLALPIVLLGVTGSLVKGIGYTPDNKALRAVFSTTCSWVLMGLGAWLLVHH
jgi:predicted membrane protein